MSCFYKKKNSPRTGWNWQEETILTILFFNVDFLQSFYSYGSLIANKLLSRVRQIKNKFFLSPPQNRVYWSCLSVIYPVVIHFDKQKKIKRNNRKIFIRLVMRDLQNKPSNSKILKSNKTLLILFSRKSSTQRFANW